MRIVTTACTVLAILFAVGCQQLTEKQKADLDKISSIEAKLNKLETEYNKAINEPNEGLTKKVADIEAFLKDKNSKFGNYGMPVPPPETKKEEPKKGAKPTGKEEPKKEEPKKEPPAKKEPGKTK